MVTEFNQTPDSDKVTAYHWKVLAVIKALKGYVNMWMGELLDPLTTGCQSDW